MYKIEAGINGISPLRYNRFLVRTKDEPNKGKMTEEQQRG